MRENRSDIIYESFGIEIAVCGGKHFLRYDGGELVHKICETEISEKESAEIQSMSSEHELYEYMISNLSGRLYF